MATAVLRSHDPLKDRLHLAAFSPSPLSPPKPHRRRHPRPSAATSPPPKPAAPSRRSPPAKPSRKPPSPAKEKPKPRLVMEEVRILKRGEEPPAPAPAQAEPDHLLCSTSRFGPPEPAVVPAKIAVVSGAGSDPVGYAGPAFSSASPEPSSLPFPAFFLRKAEAEATRGLRYLLRIGELS